MMLKTGFGRFAVTGLLAFALVGQAGATDLPNLDRLGLEATRATASGEPYWTMEPVYFEETDTYYQFFRDFRGSHSGVNWKEAQSFASRASYKGRRGRLAVVESSAVHEFLVTHFPVRFTGNTWIGLRYWCIGRRLKWTDGRGRNDVAFAAWHAQWFRNPNITCSNSRRMDYMPVYIDSATLRWQASGQLKRFPHYVVEYPPAPVATAEAQ